MLAWLAENWELISFVIAALLGGGKAGAVRARQRIHDDPSNNYRDPAVVAKEGR